MHDAAPGGVTFRLNGHAVSARAPATTALICVLRDEFALHAVHFGCGTEACGSCLVLLDGAPTHSCRLPLERIAGRAVTTPEGIGTADAPHPLQSAFLAEQAAQCGYCLGGILIAAKALLDRNPDPSRAEIAAALAGNLCRCGAHNRMVRAIQRAASELGAARP